MFCFFPYSSSLDYGTLNAKEKQGSKKEKAVNFQNLITAKFWSDIMLFGDNYDHNGIRSMQIMVIAFLNLSLSTRENIRKCLDYMWHIELNTDLY